MSYTTWDNQRFCEVSDLVAKCGGSLSGITLSSDAATSNAIAVAAIATGKERLRRKMINQCQRAFPDCNSRLVQIANKSITQAQADFYSQFHASGIDAMTTLSWNANAGFSPIWFSNWLFQWNVTRPRVFWWSGAPDADAYAGFADIGDFLGDTVNGFIYVNYGTNPAVTWTKFQPEQLIDYVSNPTELKDANTYAAIVACLESGLLRQGVSSAARAAALDQLSFFRPESEKIISDCFQNVIPALAGMTDILPWVDMKLNRRKYASIS